MRNYVHHSELRNVAYSVSFHPYEALHKFYKDACNKIITTTKKLVPGWSIKGAHCFHRGCDNPVRGDI